MGAERWIMFSSKKVALSVRNFLGEISYIRNKDDEVYLEWSSPTTLEVGYSFGGNSREMATIVCRELSKRFVTRKIGIDSVGWYDDKDWKKSGERSATVRFGAYQKWADWIKDYDPVKFHYAAKYLEEEEKVWLTELDTWISYFFTNLEKQ